MSKTNDAALDAFIAAKAEIVLMLARLVAQSTHHFGYSPDAGGQGHSAQRECPAPSCCGGPHAIEAHRDAGMPFTAASVATPTGKRPASGALMFFAVLSQATRAGRQNCSGTRSPRSGPRPPTSSPAALGRTASARASTPGSATNCAMARSSTVSPRQGSSSRTGAATAIRSARIQPWATGLPLRRPCSGRLRHPEPLRRPPPP